MPARYGKHPYHQTPQELDRERWYTDIDQMTTRTGRRMGRRVLADGTVQDFAVEDALTVS